MIEAKETLTGSITSSSTLEGSLNKAIEYISPTTQEKTITPKKEQQIVVPDDGVFALSKVTVEEIPNEYVEVSGTLDITSNGEYDVKNYEKANVNVGGVQIDDASYLFYNSTRVEQAEKLISLVSPNCTKFKAMFSLVWSETLPYVNTANGENFSEMYRQNTILKEIPLLDTKNGTNFEYFAKDCDAITQFPLIDTGKGTNFGYFLDGCDKLEKIPLLNTSNGTNFQYAFRQCSAITEFPQIDTGNAKSVNYMIYLNKNLISIPLLNFQSANNISSVVARNEKLTTLGGFKDLGKAYETTRSANYSSYKLDLSESPLLTHDSLMNVINNLYDIASKGVKAQQLVLGATNLAKLTEEEIAIATNKGWTVS